MASVIQWLLPMRCMAVIVCKSYKIATAVQVSSVQQGTIDVRANVMPQIIMV